MGGGLKRRPRDARDEKIDRLRAKIRHDNGTQYISHDRQSEIAWLGVKSSTSFVRTPEAGVAVIGGLVASLVGSAWARAALHCGVTAFAILLFLLALRRSGERAGRLAGRLETTEEANDIQRRMLEAAARRPRDRNDLVDRLRKGRF